MQVLFYFEEEIKCALVGYQEINCHVIFDVNMKFTKKAHFVGEGDQKEPRASATYDSGVSR